MSKKEEIGRGIRALLENIDTDVNPDKPVEKASFAGAMFKIPLEQIEVNPFQPRADFNETKLTELAESIKVHGVIQPITVRKLNDTKFQLIAGERRLRASKLAGLTEIPAYIRTANDQEMLEMGLIENIQRENLNAIEVAINYKRLIDECKLTQENLGARIGKDRSTVTNFLRLLKLPPEIQSALKSGDISVGHARALLGLENILEQIDLFKEVIKKSLSVRQTEELVKRYKQKLTGKPRTKKPLPFAYKKVQDRIASALSTKVTLKHNNTGKGEIVIHYYSDDDLNRLLEIIDDE
jgi:ParB family transcriptional regulator, chromosome partitioning protein